MKQELHSIFLKINPTDLENHFKTRDLFITM